MSISTISAAVELFRQHDSTAPIQMFAAFLDIAQHEGTPVNEVGRRTGQSISSITRTCYFMSKVFRAGKPGLDLVRVEQNPANRRENLCYLTNKGKHLAQSLNSLK